MGEDRTDRKLTYGDNPALVIAGLYGYEVVIWPSVLSVMNELDEIIEEPDQRDDCCNDLR